MRVTKSVKIIASLSCSECDELRFVGIDCEWKPSFNKGQKHPAALLQLATPSGHCFLFRICKIGFLPDAVKVQKLIGKPSQGSFLIVILLEYFARPFHHQSGCRHFK